MVQMQKSQSYEPVPEHGGAWCLRDLEEIDDRTISRRAFLVDVALRLSERKMQPLPQQKLNEDPERLRC